MYPDRVSRNLIIPTLSPPLILSTQNALVAALVAAVAAVALVAAVTLRPQVLPNHPRLTLPWNKKMDLPVEER